MIDELPDLGYNDLPVIEVYTKELNNLKIIEQAMIKISEEFSPEAITINFLDGKDLTFKDNNSLEKALRSFKQEKENIESVIIYWGSDRRYFKEGNKELVAYVELPLEYIDKLIDLYADNSLIDEAKGFELFNQSFSIEPCIKDPFFIYVAKRIVNLFNSSNDYAVILSNQVNGKSRFLKQSEFNSICEKELMDWSNESLTKKTNPMTAEEFEKMLDEVKKRI